MSFWDGFPSLFSYYKLCWLTWILNQLCIPGINFFAYDTCMALFEYGWIWFTNILLRIIVLHKTYWSLVFFSCKTFNHFFCVCHRNVCLIKWLGVYLSLLFSESLGTLECLNQAAKPSAPIVLFVGRFSLRNSVSLIDIKLFILSVSVLMILSLVRNWFQS